MIKKETTNSSKPTKSTMLAHTKTKLKNGNQASATKPKSNSNSNSKSTSPPKGTMNLRKNYNKKYGNQIPNYSKNVKK
jgi:hypothetical protein